MSEVVLDRVLPPSAGLALVCRRRRALTLTDRSGGGNVSMLLYSAADPLERYCMPDTLKCQHVSRLTTGVALYSDMGRVLASIVADDCGWHDTICGHSTPRIVADRWGTASYQEHRNDWRRSGREIFLVELAKHGLGPRDLVANVNFFSRVNVSDDGALALAAGNSPAGSAVTLRFELDALVVLANTPHPLSATWAPGEVGLRVDAIAPDAVHATCPENERGFAVTEGSLR